MSECQDLLRNYEFNFDIFKIAGINSYGLTMSTHYFINILMKTFNWNEDKNKWLQRERGVSFEQVVFCIENEKLLDIIKHPNQEKYKGQCFYVVDIDNYALIVPYVESESAIFLKTIFPSRKYTKIYIRQETKDETV